MVAVQFGRLMVVLWSSSETAAGVRFPAVALISAYLLFVSVVFYRSSRVEEDETVALLLRRLGILTMIFAPASTLFYLLWYRLEALGRLHISLDFFYFSAWSIIAASVFFRFMTRPTAILEDGRVSPAFVSAFKISPREEEVVRLISLGLSNRQIADKLFVSFTTVRTHVYNIFRKTGARSRVELLRILSGYKWTHTFVRFDIFIPMFDYFFALLGSYLPHQQSMQGAHNERTIFLDCNSIHRRWGNGVRR